MLDGPTHYRLPPDVAAVAAFGVSAKFVFGVPCSHPQVRVSCQNIAIVPQLLTLARLNLTLFLTPRAKNPILPPPDTLAICRKS